MSNVITTKIAEYDVQEFREFEIKHYLNNIPEFLERYEFYILKDLRQVGSLKPSEVTESIIEDVVWQDENLGGDAYEQFESDMSYFDKYIGETMYIKGENMGWQNRTGYKEGVIESGMDIFEAIQVNSDLTFRIWKESDIERVYFASMSHHDSPTGESYEIQIKQ